VGSAGRLPRRRTGLAMWSRKYYGLGRQRGVGSARNRWFHRFPARRRRLGSEQMA